MLEAVPYEAANSHDLHLLDKLSPGCIIRWCSSSSHTGSLSEEEDAASPEEDLMLVLFLFFFFFSSLVFLARNQSSEATVVIRTKTCVSPAVLAKFTMASKELLAKNVLRYFKDFPKPGINFVDIHPLMSHPEARAEVMHVLADRYRGKVDAIAGLESRGFYFAVPLACELGLPFVSLRKPGPH